MRLAISGFERELEIIRGVATVLEITDKTLFTRICQSLHSELGAEAIEPYVVWSSEGKKLRPDKALLCVYNPFDLPWNDRLLLKKVLDRLEDILQEDEKIRMSIEGATNSLSRQIEELSLALRSDYAFDVEWNMKDYLNAFDFEIDFDVSDSLLDNLLRFIRLAEDAMFDGVLCFMNLKTFLSRNELEQVYKQAFFSNIRMLLLEGAHDEASLEYENKMLIDQCFFQS